MRPDLQMEMMPVASLAAYAANARMHPTEQVAQLAASIAEFGFNVPVLVDDAGVLLGFNRSSQHLCAPISAPRQRLRRAFSSQASCAAGC